MIDLNTLKPNPNNPRKISVDAKSRLRDSINGFEKMMKANPIKVDENNVILSGNQRYHALLDLGYNSVPDEWIKVIDYFTEEEKQEYIVKDNYHSGEFDYELFETEYWEETDYKEWLDLDEEEIHLEAKEDDYVAPAEIQTDIVRGDLFEFKKGDLTHRLLCGDSTNVDNVEKLMDGKKADMVFTDPPYNTGMSQKTNSDSTRLNHMFNDAYTDEEWDDFLNRFLDSYLLSINSDCTLYICLDWRRNHELMPKLKERFKVSNCIVWDKVVHGLGSDYKYTYELINVCKHGNPSLNTHQGEREYSDVWHIQRKIGRDDDHATKKPIELVERGIRHASLKGNLVLDLFMGSGSTLLASHQLKRNCYGMELNENYCQVGVDRMLKLDEDIQLFRNGIDVTEKYRNKLRDGQ